MTAVLTAYLESLVPALGWTLAHFLWQGALVALVLQLLLRTCRTARARHDLALAALVLMAILPIATFALLKSDVRVVLVPPGFPALAAGHGLSWEAAAVAAWLTGVAVLAIRTAGGLLLIERLRRGASPLPPEWVQRCRALHSRMAGSLSVVFAQSEAIAAPLVAGWLKPMVLIPTAALARLPVEQLEALILHELAHVRRLDAFANLVQSFVETALFYHPAVWWVSRRIRIEREHCCDDLAVSAVQDPALYVRALQGIEAMRAAPFGVLAANGGDLTSRAARILDLAAAPARPALSRTGAVLILTAAAAAMTHSAAVQATPSQAPRTAPAPASVAEPVAQTHPTAAAATQAPPVVERAPTIVLAEAAAPVAAQQVVLAAAAPEAPAPAAPAPSRSVSPLVVSPQARPPAPDVKIDMAGSDRDIDPRGLAIWPSTAYQARYDGQVTLRCRFGVRGLAEICEVASETPKGRGFGKAALEMRPTFKLPPTMGPDGPIASTRTIAINFKAPDTQFEWEYVANCGGNDQSADFSCSANPQTLNVLHNPLKMRQVTMLDYPVWARAATFDDLARAYPARGGGVEGFAVAHCRVLHSGDLTECQIIKETPERRGFGQAAMSLTPRFRVAAQLADTHHLTPLWVDVPIRLPPPSQLAERTVEAPSWVNRIDQNRPPKIFPPEAAASGVTSGKGVARCVVAGDGSMTQCTPEPAEPAGMGFSEAAVRLASTLKMNLWSADGAPVEGGVVYIPVRLNLKGG